MEGTIKFQSNSPHLIYYHEEENIKNQIFYHLKDKKCQVKSIKQMEYTKCIPTWTGWMLVIHPRGQCYFLDPLSMSKISMPRFNWKITGQPLCTLSCSPNDPNCIVVRVDLVKKFFLFCKPSDKTWFKYSYSNENVRLVDVVSSNHAFYGLTCQDKFVSIVVNHDTKIIIINELEEINLKWPTGFGSSSMYLVECCREMLVLDRYYLGTHAKNTRRICIKRRDEATLKWEEVDDIGDRVIFLGYQNFAVSWSASDVCLKRNCVYFVDAEDPVMYCYDIEEGIISIHIPAPSLRIEGLTPIWIMPAV